MADALKSLTLRKRHGGLGVGSEGDFLVARANDDIAGIEIAARVSMQC